MMYSLMIDGVMARSSRDKRINVKLRESLRLEFAAVSRLRDLSMSDMVRQFIIRTVHEVKQNQPEEFQEALTYVLANPEKAEKIGSKTDQIQIDEKGNAQTLQLPVENSGKREKDKQSA